LERLLAGNWGGEDIKGAKNTKKLPSKKFLVFAFFLTYVSAVETKPRVATHGFGQNSMAGEP
jgi:hypothetical protein